MKKRALTKARLTRIARMRADGYTRAEIAERVGISPASVSGAFKLLQPKQRPAASPPQDASESSPAKTNGEPKPPPQTPDEFRTWLGEQMVELELEAKTARAAGEHERAARAQRNLSQMILLYGRVTKSADESDTLTVTLKALAEAAQECREAMLELLDRADQTATRLRRKDGTE